MARSVGVDIGSFSIKVAELEGQLKSSTVRDFYEIPLNHEPGQDLRLDKIEALKKVAATYDPSKYTITVGLGSEFSTARVLNFPFFERRKILQSLPFELEDVIPFSQSDAIFDFRLIHQKTNSSKVLALAVPKKHIQDLLILCEDAGLNPDIISLDGIALANHFENIFSGPVQVDGEETVAARKTEMAIHIGYSKTLIDVIQDRSLIATRALYFGGKDIANAISRAYSLPYLEALKAVQEKAFVLTSNDSADEDQVAFSDVIVQSLNNMVTDLQRTIVDLKSELQCEFSEGHLMGGMGGLINLGPYLTSRLQIPVSVYHHLGKRTKADIPPTAENEKASTIAIGLGLEGLRKPKNPAVNLRKNEFVKKNRTLELFFDQYKNVAKLGIVFFIIFWVYSSFRSSFADDNLRALEKSLKDQAKGPLIGLSNSQAKPENIRKVIKAKREEIESKKSVLRLSQMNSALDVLKDMSAALPGKPLMTLDIRHLNLENDRLSIEGYVNSKSELDSVQKTLATLSFATRVTMGRAAPVVNGKLPFSLSMALNRMPPAEKSK